MAYRIKRSWEVFDKYYAMTDDSSIYAAALILHPNRRVRYIQQTWKKAWQSRVLASVKRLWESYRSEIPLAHQVTASYNRLQKPPADDFDRIAQEINDNLPRPSSRDEYEDYCKGELVDIGRQTALDWWLKDEQRARWPQLSYMAIDILSIPAMSAEAERVFSGARRTISWDRAKLNAETIEKIESLKHWKRSGILTFELLEE